MRFASQAAAALAVALAGCDGATPNRAGLDARPVNATCLAPATPAGMAPDLGATGCFDPGDLRRPTAGLIPYDVIAPLWSDGATKQRYLALPEGARITSDASGDLDFPTGTVLAKRFELAGAPVETRLFVRHADGAWAGYSYRFTDDGTGAQLVGADAEYRMVGQQEWQFPGRQHCLDCHTEAAGFTLGLELGQLDRDYTYPGGRTANQLTTFAAIDLFAASPPGGVAPLPDPRDPGANLGARARSYLHSNCANCHRPGGSREPNVTMDLRFSTPLAETAACAVPPNRTDLGIADAMLLFPGDPALSVVSLRMHSLIPSLRMPPVASSVVDPEGTLLVDDWIRALSCLD